MKNRILFMVLLAAGNYTAYCQNSFLDSSFGNNGIVITPPPNAVTYSKSDFLGIALQPDHKIVAAGMADGYALVVRYNENGTLDNSFANNGIFKYSIQSVAEALAVQPDGKIIVAGSWDTAFGNSDFFTMRLNTNGDIDNTFGIGGVAVTDFYGADDYSNNMALQSDGKIIIAGRAGTSIGLVRLIANGSRDSAFGVNGLVTYPADEPEGISVMADGRIVIGCRPYNFYMAACRFMPDGTLDTTFNHTGFTSILASDTYNYCGNSLLQPDGKVLVCGSGTFGNAGGRYVILRFNANGTLDNTYGNNGVDTIGFADGNADGATAMYRTQDNKVLVIGESSSRFALIRIDSNGKVDSSFGNNGRITTYIQDGPANPQGIVQQSDSRIVLGGLSYNSDQHGDDGTLACYTNTATGVKHIVKSSYKVNLYPNPASGVINLQGDTGEIESIQATDAAGKNIPIITSLADKKIYLNNLPEGFYFFTILFKDQSPATQKILVRPSE